jgi:hypothetical protein
VLLLYGNMGIGARLKLLLLSFNGTKTVSCLLKKE